MARAITGSAGKIYENITQRTNEMAAIRTGSTGYDNKTDSWYKSVDQDLLVCIAMITLVILLFIVAMGLIITKANQRQNQEINLNDYQVLTRWNEEYNKPKCIKDAANDNVVTKKEFKQIQNQLKDILTIKQIQSKETFLQNVNKEFDFELKELK